jgi:hypothetical protein
MNTPVSDLERARRLLAELKQLYDDLSAEERDCVRKQFRYCAENCVPREEAHV